MILLTGSILLSSGLAAHTPSSSLQHQDHPSSSTPRQMFRVCSQGSETDFVHRSPVLSTSSVIRVPGSGRSGGAERVFDGRTWVRHDAVKMGEICVLEGGRFTFPRSLLFILSSFLSTLTAITYLSEITTVYRKNDAEWHRKAHVHSVRNKM